MRKVEELIAEYTSEVIEKLNSCGMLPFISKEKALKVFVEFSNTIAETYRIGADEIDRKLLSRLAELDKLYEKREQERQETFIKLMREMKSEMVRASRIAFCRGVCKYSSSVPNTALCYCARRQRFLESLEEDLDKYIQDNEKKLTTKYKEVSWKREK